MSTLRRMGVWAILGPGVIFLCLLFGPQRAPAWLAICFGLVVGCAAAIAGERFDAWWVAHRTRREDR